MLKNVDEQSLKNNDNFSGEYIVYEDKNELLEKVREDILYQREMAAKIIKFSKEKPVKTKIASYHWVAEIEELNEFNYLNINLHVKPEDLQYGNIIFPITIVLSDSNKFIYYEILHVDDALEAIRELIGMKN